MPYLNKNSTGLFRILLLVATLCISPAVAFAYIDPGTGSFVIQGIIAAVVGAGVVVKMFWHRIKGALGLKPNSEDDEDDE